MHKDTPRRRPWRNWLHVTIFGTESKPGQLFDIVLLVAIVISVTAVLLESVPSIGERWGAQLFGLEVFFTLLFTIEYILRLLSAKSSLHYARSFMGVVDLLSILPTYFVLFLPADMAQNAQALLVLRTLRLLRIFRVLKLTRYVEEASLVAFALRRSRKKVIVFFIGVLSVVFILGTVIYLVEGPENGFDSIPIGIYWATITVTTVGYGDLVPSTSLGKAIATFGVLIGYAIIAVPTGIVTSELTLSLQHANAKKKFSATQTCPRCDQPNLPHYAHYCFRCGYDLNNDPDSFRQAAQGGAAASAGRSANSSNSSNSSNS